MSPCKQEHCPLGGAIEIRSVLMSAVASVLKAEIPLRLILSLGASPSLSRGGGRANTHQLRNGTGANHCGPQKAQERSARGPGASLYECF
ncbi:hypothetical protein SKAU_G00365120 [Synaphobranchus kaupii]|uniref:Uncharacterized protein n=1 Tax=Synaphobranchus kaupii TaxID=118154 RepID=A0A9Q1IFF0_SYNKA|nr:hypothetical protein SKAU_G00365120 [Synaphobranchus kaupii]